MPIITSSGSCQPPLRPPPTATTPPAVGSQAVYLCLVRAQPAGAIKPSSHLVPDTTQLLRNIRIEIQQQKERLESARLAPAPYLGPQFIAQQEGEKTARIRHMEWTMQKLRRKEEQLTCPDPDDKKDVLETGMEAFSRIIEEQSKAAG